MRHAEVAYFDEHGDPVNPATVVLTDEGRRQAVAARDALAGIAFDLVVATGLERTAETARIVAGVEPERWPELNEWEGGRLHDIPEEELEDVFTGALRIAGDEERFLGGESLGEVRARVEPAFDRLLAREWDTCLAVLHGGINRVLLSYALVPGGRPYLGGFEQAAACVNVLDVGLHDWIVRTVNYIPYDPLHPARDTTMERYWSQWRRSR